MVDVYFTGSLLVASPTLEDPNFVRTVILLLDHDADGRDLKMVADPQPLSDDQRARRPTVVSPWQVRR